MSTIHVVLKNAKTFTMRNNSNKDFSVNQYNPLWAGAVTVNSLLDQQQLIGSREQSANIGDARLRP